MQKPVIIFDLDGTLLNSIIDIGESCNKALHQNTLPTHSQEEYKTFVGWGAKNLIKKAIAPIADEAVFEKVYSDYCEIYQRRCEQLCSPFPGVPAMLHDLHRLGAKIAVFTNKPHEQTTAICEHTFAGLIDFYIGEKEGSAIKPCPDGIEIIQEVLGATCIAYIGDSNVDIETGKNAGVFTIGVSWGMQPRRNLEDLKPDKIVDKVPELHEHLVQIVSNYFIDN